jgi:hypothetical protein
MPILKLKLASWGEGKKTDKGCPERNVPYITQ